MPPPEFDDQRREVSGISRHPIVVGDEPLRFGELVCRSIGERIEIENARRCRFVPHPLVAAITGARSLLESYPSVARDRFRRSREGYVVLAKPVLAGLNHEY